jgi:hypothetical protein
MEIAQNPAVETTATNNENSDERSPPSIPDIVEENLPITAGINTQQDSPAQQQLETTFVNADTPVIQFRVQRNLSLVSCQTLNY